MLREVLKRVEELATQESGATMQLTSQVISLQAELTESRTAAQASAKAEADVRARLQATEAKLAESERQATAHQAQLKTRIQAMESETKNAVDQLEAAAKRREAEWGRSSERLTTELATVERLGSMLASLSSALTQLDPSVWQHVLAEGRRGAGGSPVDFGVGAGLVEMRALMGALQQQLNASGRQEHLPASLEVQRLLAENRQLAEENVRLRLLVGDDDDTSEPNVDIAMALLRAIKTELASASAGSGAKAHADGPRQSPKPESSFEFKEISGMGSRSQSRASNQKAVPADDDDDDDDDSVLRSALRLQTDEASALRARVETLEAELARAIAHSRSLSVGIKNSPSTPSQRIREIEVQRVLQHPFARRAARKHDLSALRRTSPKRLTARKPRCWARSPTWRRSSRSPRARAAATSRT